MKLSHVLLLAGAASQTTASEMALDLVFPGNGTYKNVTELPIIFALTNADSSFQFGFMLGWRIERAKTSINTTTGGMPYGNIIQSSGGKSPLNAVDNIWYASGHVLKMDDLPPGDYSLRWDWMMTYCNKSQGLTTYRPSRTVAEGSVNFALAPDGETMDLTKNCPVFLTQLTVSGVSSGNCPFISESKEKHDTCEIKMSKDMASCVMANLTESGDNSTCSKLVRVTNDDDDDNNNSSTNGNSTSDGSSGSDKDSSGTVISASTFGTMILLATMGGFLLF